MTDAAEPDHTFAPAPAELSLVAALTDGRKRVAALPADAPPLRVLVLGALTLNDLKPFLERQIALLGRRPEVAFGGFDTVRQECLTLEPERWDAVVIALEAGLLGRGALDPEAALRAVRGHLDALAERSAAPVFLNDAIALAPPTRGALAADLPADPHAALQRLNDGLETLRRERSAQATLVRWSALLATLGRAQALRPERAWRSAAPFTHAFLALWAAEIGAGLRARLGLSKKCLVLDADGVLWGGVLGEDGLEGVALGPTGAPDAGHYALQAAALDLKRNGVLLALASKNEERDVWAALERHPHALLKPADFAASRIGWRPKGETVREIAEELNIGLDSLVFLDDSAVECAQVAAFAPDVAVRQAPADPERLAAILGAEGLFARVSATAEDGARTEMIRAEGARRAAAAAATDLEGFLAELGVWAEIQPLTEETAARAAQLANKTNQFNLTVRRYAAAEIEALIGAPDALALTLRAGDRFGALGHVGLAVLRREGDAAAVEALALSCRALGRGLEWTLLDAMAGAAQARFGAARLLGRYVAGPKNQQVADYWERAGFTQAGDGYGADLADWRPRGGAHVSVGAVTDGRVERWRRDERSG